MWLLSSSVAVAEWLTHDRQSSYWKTSEKRNTSIQFVVVVVVVVVVEVADGRK